MAIFRSFLLGDVRKSVSNLTMYAAARGNSIVRSKKMKIRNPRTVKQVTQREKMAALVGLSREFAPVLALGFPERVGNTTPYNAFVKANVDAVTVDEQMEATVDYTRVVCAFGSLKKPKVTVNVDTETSNLLFTQAASKHSLSVQEAATDMVYAVVFEKELKEMEIVPLKERGKGGEVTYQFDSEWKAANLLIYAFAVSKGRRKVSGSIFIQPA